MALNGQVTLAARFEKDFFLLSYISKAGVKDTVGCEPPFLVAFITGLQFPIALWLREPTEQGFKPGALAVEQ